MADPLLDRDAKVTYGSLVLGGAASSTNYHLVGKLELQEGYVRGYSEFDVLVQGEDESTFLTRSHERQSPVAIGTKSEGLGLFIV